MRGLRWVLPVLALAGCWEFDKKFDERCRQTVAGLDSGFLDSFSCDAGLRPLGGGMGGGSGGSGGGSGGGSVGGGGGGGGVIMCTSRADSGCFGAGEWCWEFPSPISNDLFVAFTTPDAGGMWAAGAGPTLLYFEGGAAVTNKTGLLTLRTPSDLYDEAPAITGAVVTNDRVVLIGNRIDMQQSVGSSAFTPLYSGDWDTIGSDSHGRLYGVESKTRGTLQRIDPLDPMQFHYDPTNTTGPLIRAVGFDSSDYAFVTTGTDNRGFRFDVSAIADGGATVIEADAGLVLSDRVDGALGPVARLQDGGVIVGGAGLLYRHDGANWLDAGLLPFTGATASIVASGSQLWVFGEAGEISEVNSATSSGLPTGVWSATAAPGGDAWIAGSRGMLGRVQIGISTTQPAVPGNDIQNLFVTNEFAFAAQNEAVFERVGSTWTSYPPLSGPTNGRSWIAVAVVPKSGVGRVVWAVDRSGTLYKSDGATAQRVLQLPPPFIAYKPRSAAALPLPDGGALLGVGSAILRLSESNALDFDGNPIITLPDGGAPPEVLSAPVDMITGLAATDQVTIVTGHTQASETSSVYSRLPTSSWNLVFETDFRKYIEDVTACPSGAFVVAGDHGLLFRLNPAGGGPPDPAWVQEPPVYVDFASAWCGPNDEAWALARSGHVVRFATDKRGKREPTGWGRRDNTDNLSVSTIRGNSSFIFISGGSSALISRPLCP